MGVSDVLVKFQCAIFLLLRVPVASAEIPINASRPITKPGCQDRCGIVSIPYPFGIGEGCSIDKNFELNCSDSAKPMSEKMPGWTTFNHFAPFTLSNTRNKFIAMGCDTYAYLQLGDKRDNTALGCTSVCDTTEDISDGSCTGFGCCEASIPPGIGSYIITVRSVGGTRRNLSFNPCSYAFLIEESSFQFSKSYLKEFLNNGKGVVPVVVDWTVGNETCEIAKRNLTSYACGPNTNCTSSKISPGYRCNCKNIDECYEKRYDDERCSSARNICINTDGGYRCPCRQGFDSQNEKNGISDCIPRLRNSNRIVVGLVLLVVSLVASFWLYWGYRKRKHMQVKEEFFKQNGGLILNRLLDEREEDIEASRNRRGGKKHRSVATIYTENELTKATNNYHESHILGRGGFGTVYKGILSNGTVVAIKKTKIFDSNQNEQFINEIAVLSQINHKNVVQLLGCCLESEVPLLVYEFVTNGTLHQHLHKGRGNQTGFATLSWENRLRIALEVAGALAYLHAEASIPIIHRDVKSSNVLLDDDYKAKVSDFGASRLNPTDQAQLSTVVQGTFGYLDPEYMLSNKLTEKSDVYSFGVLLVELLTGKAVFCLSRDEGERNLANYFLSTMKTNRLFVILDSNLVRYDNEQISTQKCLRIKGEKRPTMKEVAMVLHGLIVTTSNYHGGFLLDDDQDLYPITDKEERRLLSESAKGISYTDSNTTIGDSNKEISTIQTEGR
ncbi:hypothetical protein MKX01_042809 [Papaver californicum]|nr:hypothetical protein MKX01_042809 [Papaver californicum]